MVCCQWLTDQKKKKKPEGNPKKKHKSARWKQMENVCTKWSIMTDKRLTESSHLQDNYDLSKQTYHELVDVFLPFQQQNPTKKDDIQLWLRLSFFVFWPEFREKTL